MDSLYGSPGSCSLIVDCPLNDFGVPFGLKRVDIEASEPFGAKVA